MAAAGCTFLRLALTATFFRLRYDSRRWRLMTLLYCLPIRIFTSLRCFDFVCVTMVIRPTRFNIYLLGLVLLATVTGCRSPEGKRSKQLATIRVHVEVNTDSLGLSEAVPIYRANPTMVNINRSPFLNEANVAEAKVVTDTLGGFALTVRFDSMGMHLLEQATATSPGRRMAIFAEFGEKGLDHRWLAAPRIARRISNGVISFTPDATRDEAEQIAIGLNNVAIKNGNQEKSKKGKSKDESK